MNKHSSARKKALRKRRIFLSCCALVLIALIAITTFALNAIFKKSKKGSSSRVSSSQLIDSSSAEYEEPYIISSATVVNTGDIMVHSTQLDGAYVSSTSGYDFSAFFKEASSYFKKADLAVANLEVTFGGSESGKYSGYPAFNTPDSLADAIKQSGLNFLVTANNHCYDTGLYGLKRTAQVLKQNNLSFVGTKETASDPTYVVKDVNGIKIGIANYTYETTGTDSSRKYLNGAVIAREANSLVNTFSYEHIETFYTEAQKVITDMKQDGADCVVFYVHWGNEYQLKPSNQQKSIAQKLCDLGVNVIVGSHPHVVQPIELLHSEVSQNTAVCLYSTGNAISNQRQELMDSCPSGHTEDGVLFTYKFDKYSDDTVKLSSVDIIPIWVNKYKGGSGYQYTMYPLDTKTSGADKYGLSSTAAAKSAASYDRTKAIVSSGLNECQQFIGCPITLQ